MTKLTNNQQPSEIILMNIRWPQAIEWDRTLEKYLYAMNVLCKDWSKDRPKGEMYWLIESKCVLVLERDRWMTILAQLEELR